MKLICGIFLISLGTLAPLQSQELSDLRWQYRILLIMDPMDNPQSVQQIKMFRSERAAMQARDVLLFIFNGKSLLDENGNISPIGTKELPSPTFEGVILIGKDGGVKLRKPFLVAPEEVFKRIDSMPMRRAELRDGDHR